MAVEEVFISNCRKKYKTSENGVKIQNLCSLSHFPKPSSGRDGSLCWADSGPSALCLAPAYIRVEDKTLNKSTILALHCCYLEWV